MVEYIGRHLKINIKTKKGRAGVNSKRKVTFNGHRELSHARSFKATNRHEGEIGVDEKRMILLAQTTTSFIFY